MYWNHEKEIRKNETRRFEFENANYLIVWIIILKIVSHSLCLIRYVVFFEISSWFSKVLIYSRAVFLSKSDIRH